MPVAVTDDDVNLYFEEAGSGVTVPRPRELGGVAQPFQRLQPAGGVSAHRPEVERA
jgi:hypothetical protein